MCRLTNRTKLFLSRLQSPFNALSLDYHTMSEKRQSGKRLPSSEAPASGKRKKNSAVNSNESLSGNSDDNSTRNIDILAMENMPLSQGPFFLELTEDFETLTSATQDLNSKMDAVIECKIDLITEFENITNSLAQFNEKRLESTVLKYIDVKSNIEMIKRDVDENHNVEEMIEIMESESSQELDDAKWTLKYTDPNNQSNLINLNGNNVNNPVFVKMDNFYKCVLLARDCIHLARLLMDEIFIENALKTCSLFGPNGLDKTAVVVIVNSAMSYGSLNYTQGADKTEIVESMANKLSYHRTQYI